MNDPEPGLTGRVAELREAFDRSFALPLADRAEKRQLFLIWGVGAQAYAVALDALLGIERHRKVVPLPLRSPGLLGLAGFRGQLAPVFSMATLLGSGDGAESPAWLAFCKGPTPIALAFDRQEGAAQVAAADVSAAEAKEGLSPLTRQTVRVGTRVLPVLDLPSVAAAARQRLKKE